MLSLESLWLFVSIHILTTLVLIVDAILVYRQLPTVTDYAKANAWFAILLVVALEAQPLCMALHFFT